MSPSLQLSCDSTDGFDDGNMLYFRLRLHPGYRLVGHHPPGDPGI